MKYPFRCCRGLKPFLTHRQLSEFLDSGIVQGAFGYLRIDSQGRVLRDYCSAMFVREWRSVMHDPHAARPTLMGF